MNRRAIEALVRAGALDSLGTERWILMAAIDDALRAAEQNTANSEAGMVDLFGDAVVTAAATSGDPYGDYRAVRAWADRERLSGEKETLGLYVTGHPIDEYEAEIRRMAPNRIVDLRPDRGPSQRVAGLVIALRTTRTARGTMAIATVDDRSARIEMTVYAEAYGTCRDVLVKDAIVVAEGRVAQDDYSGGLVLRASEVHSLDEERQRLARRLTIEVSEAAVDDGFADFLASALGGAPGACPVRLVYCAGDVRAPVQLGERWQVTPTDELLQALRERIGGANVSLAYAGDH